MQNRKLNILLPLMFSLVLVVGMIIGFRLRESTWSKPPVAARGDYNRLEEILSIIESKYVDTFDRQKAMDGLIEDLVTQLDPHSFFIPASELKEVNESLEGNFEGIGIEFYILHDTIVVVTPISGGPSEALGIMSGDKIIKIEDTVVAGTGITNNDVVKKLRGKKGTKVKVSIQRNQESELLDFVITRDKIPIASLDAAYMVDKETGYIRLTRFSGTTYKEFAEGVKRLKEQGMKRLILDLRQNPGGYLEAAVHILDELIDDEKLVLYTEGRSYRRKEYRARLDGLFEKGPLVVLIDEGSASASEIVAGAVQDLDRGLVVGRRSFGKGLVQEQYNLRDGSALRLTVARYYTPSGRSIQKPYSNGKEKYYNEITERFYHGEYQSADSVIQNDSLKYYTLSGKVVYGGGGIMPDIFVPIDSLTDLQTLAQVRSYIPEFVLDRFSNNREFFEQFPSLDAFADGYYMPDSLFADFIRAARQQGLQTDDQTLIGLRHKIKVLLKAQIARQEWKNEGFYRIYNTMDKTFLKAYEALDSLHAAGGRKP
ncbi:MAG: peptidase S41 [Chitinophagales bacterium]|nr:MAG: peptidase S41 [Chitinophagales bacterium]